jgi:hypothetical protein
MACLHASTEKTSTPEIDITVRFSRLEITPASPSVNCRSSNKDLAPISMSDFSIACTSGVMRSSSSFVSFCSETGLEQRDSVLPTRLHIQHQSEPHLPHLMWSHASFGHLSMPVHTTAPWHPHFVVTVPHLGQFL